MTTTQKIAAAEQRIEELKTLIKHWKSSLINGKDTFELLESIGHENYQKIAS